MTIQSTDRKAGPFLSGTALPFEFKVFSKEDIAVIYTNAEGVEVVLVLDSDYSVTLNADQDNNPGGTATLTTPIVSGDRANIIGDLAYDQGTDIRNQGGFEPEIIEDALDRATIQIQQLKEISDRTLKTAPGDSRTGDELLADIFEAEENAAASANQAQEILNDIEAAASPLVSQVIAAANSASASATLAGNNATSAAGSEASAALSAANALAAAEASGNVVFYDTYALANAAVAGLSDLQIVQVLVDETMQGQRTLYRKEGGVLVFKIALSELRALYVDSNIGNDANAGTNPEAPLATIGAALTPFNAVKNCTLYLGRGSQFFERDLFILGKYGKVLPFGQGLDPVIDAAYTATGTWTNDGTYTNLWYIDVTFDNATFGSASNLSSAWHPALYDEAEDSRVDECGVQRVLNGDVVGGSTVAAATIADLLAIANAGPGRFTVHRTGSTNVEPRSDNGTQFRFYLYPADGSNPNTNGRTVRVVGQEAVISQLGEGVEIDEITLQRCGGKDMMGTVTSNPIKSGKIQRSTFLEAAVHAMVMGGVKVEKCKAKSAYHRDSRRDAGGAFHQFRGQNGDGTSRGVNFLDVEAEGFGFALYSHGIPGPETDEQTVFDADVVRAKDCNALYSCASPTKGVRLKKVHATGLNSIGNLVPKGGVIIEDSEIFLVDPPPAGSFMFQAFGVGSAAGEGAKATFKNSLVVSKSTGLIDTFLVPVEATVDEYPIIELIDSTVIANITDPGNALRNRQSWVLKNSVLTKINSLFLSGNLTADATSSLEFTRLVVEDVIASFPNVNPSVLTGVRRQIYTQTIALDDLGFVSRAGRNATYSGTPNGDGTANLTLNFNDVNYGRTIRVLDAYGSGLHYVGRIVNAGVAGAGDIVVSPVPTSAFSTKQLQVGFYNKATYRDPIVGSLATNGQSASVPDATLFTVGMTIVVAKPYGRGSYGVRQVAGIAGNVVSFDVPCPWFSNNTNAASQYNTVDGSITGRLPLPQVEISFGFPIRQRTTESQAHPSVSVALVEGGVAISQQRTNLPGFLGSIRSDYDTSGNATTAGTYAIGLHNEEGFFDNGWGVAIDDVMTVTADAFVDQDKLILLSDPLTSGAYILDPECGPAKRGSGFKRSDR
jgi:hypothetical protein